MPGAFTTEDCSETKQSAIDTVSTLPPMRSTSAIGFRIGNVCPYPPTPGTGTGASQ